MKEQLLKTTLLQFQAAHAKAQSNLEIYLNNATGIGEHPDIVTEIVTLVNAITEAEEGKKYIKEKLNREYNKRN